RLTLKGSGERHLDQHSAIADRRQQMTNGAGIPNCSGRGLFRLRLREEVRRYGSGKRRRGGGPKKITTVGGIHFPLLPSARGAASAFWISAFSTTRFFERFCSPLTSGSFSMSGRPMPSHTRRHIASPVAAMFM